MQNDLDPYNGFTDDKERGRSLRTRERWRSTAEALPALAFAILEALLWWLMR